MTPDPDPDPDPDLLPSELALVRCSAQGRLLDLRPRTGGAAGDPGGVVRGHVLAALVTRGAVNGVAGARPVAVRLRGARIVGPLDMGGAELLCALELYECEVTARVSLARASGSVVSLRGSRLSGGLSGRELRLTQSLNLTGGFSCRGRVDLRGARIGGHVDAEGARLCNPRGVALDLGRARVDQGVNLMEANVAGGVELSCSVLAGIGLRLDAASVDASGARLLAVRADAADVSGGVHAPGSELTGGMALRDARVSGHLDLAGARICPRPVPTGSAPAVSADRLRVTADVRLCRTSLSGQLCLAGVSIGGALDCRATCVQTADDVAYPLVLRGARVTGMVVLRPRPAITGIDVTQADVGAWFDERATWPSRLALHDFRYGELTVTDTTPNQRIGWIGLDDSEYLPHAFLELAAFYRGTGDVRGARTIAIAMQRQRRSSGPGGPAAWASRAWSAALRWTIGYGHHPTRVLGLLAVLLAAGSPVQGWAFRHGMITAATTQPGHAPFNAFRYTFDLLLPVANLGQRAGWYSHGADAWITMGLTLCGWLLAAALLSSIGGVFRNE